jgi:hypothetical protein
MHSFTTRSIINLPNLPNLTHKPQVIRHHSGKRTYSGWRHARRFELIRQSNDLAKLAITNRQSHHERRRVLYAANAR